MYIDRSMWPVYKVNIIAFIIKNEAAYVIGNYHIMWTKETVETPTECINNISIARCNCC